MLIAKISNPVPVNYREAFPNTSFTRSGPSDQFLDEHGYAKVSVYKEYDPETQNLVPVEPYFEAPFIYTVSVVSKTNEELELSNRAKAEADLMAVKMVRQSEVDAITVTTSSGRVFDGDEDAQNRMSRAVTSMNDTDTVKWVLADNTVAVVDRSELHEALRLAGQSMSDIWVKPYI